MNGRPRFSILFILLSGLLIALSLYALTAGFVRIPFAGLYRILFNGIPGNNNTDINAGIVWNMRMPRILLAGLVGASLALAGCLLQSVLENPLADPYILGVSAGAGVGAALAMSMKVLTERFWTVPSGAFCGALIAVAAVYILSRREGVLSNLRLILYGVGIGAGLSALLSLLLLSNREQTMNVYYWMMGSVSGQGWTAVSILALVLVLVWWFAFRRALLLNTLLLGEENSFHLGVDAAALKKRLLWCSTLLTATAVSYSGLIGFVGLIIPHAGRILTGADHRRLLLLAPVAGAVLLIACDTLARTLFLPGEIPVGIITALLGGPVFILLLAREGKGP